MSRLYEAAKSRGLIDAAKEQSSLAGVLNVAPQNVNNWEKRGVSKEAALQLQLDHRFSATWILFGAKPMFIDGTDDADVQARAGTSQVEISLFSLIPKLGEPEKLYLLAKAKQISEPNRSPESTKKSA